MLDCASNIRLRDSRLFRAVLLALPFALSPYGVRAEEDLAPHLLLEPTEYTDVIDAFESEDDRFDFTVRLSFARSQGDARIERERSVAGRYALERVQVADYHSVRSALVLGAEVGLYEDLMLFGRLPLVFSDTRELRMPDAASCDSSECRQREREIRDVLADTPPDAGAPGWLFLPGPDATASTRSGVPSIDVGVAWGISNQYRSPGLPTWIVLAESRISVGSPMRACLGARSCDPGKSRGTTRLLLGTRWSYRYRFIEPYLGLDHALEWASSAEEAFEPGGDGAHLVEDGPPSVTGLTVGGAIVPWEHRGRFQEFAIDVRVRAEYVSEGRDYTPLFDVLGASSNPYLATELPRENGEPITFSGLTQVGAHARISLQLALAMQAARYVKFRLGLTLAHETGHLLTGAARCTDAIRGGGRTSEACGERVPNSLYRGVIDQPGQRFALASHLAYSLSATAAAQF